MNDKIVFAEMRIKFATRKQKEYHMKMIELFLKIIGTEVRAGHKKNKVDIKLLKPIK